MPDTTNHGLKNIWIFHHYADPPEGHWLGTYELYKFFAQKGHRVRIFTSSFSHYTRKDEHLLKNEKWKEKIYAPGLKYVFVKTYPYHSNDWKRLLNMLTYAINAYLAAGSILSSSRDEKPDIVIGSTPHPFCVLSAILVAKRTKTARIFMELHDIWLEYMIDSGKISPHGFAAKIIKTFYKYLYNRAEKIFTLWPRMNLYLNRNFNIPLEKVIWTPLGVDFNKTSIPQYRKKSDDEPFIITCTARMGPASNIDEILKSALILKKESDIGGKIRFHLYGDGPELANLIRYKEENNLDNVFFKGLIPKKEIPARLEEADVCIAGLPDIPHYARYGTIPTKLIDYIASNRPTIFISSITEDNIIDNAGCGFSVPPGRPDLLALTIKKLYSMSYEERATLGKNGVGYLKKYHNLEKLSGELEKIFNG